MKKSITTAMFTAALALAFGCCPAMSQDAVEVEAYPIHFCVVSGQKLGSMGAPVDYMHEGRLVRFCCGGCIGAFQGNPEKYLAVLDEHQAKQEAEAGEKAAPAKTGCGTNPAPVPARGCRPGCRK